MIPFSFDPFQNRLSRDIRNSLSEAFARCLTTDDLAPAQAVADHYRENPLQSVHRDYIEDRVTRYARALAIIRRTETTAAWEQGLILWDLGLFFEVHEVLEHAWHGARGTKREVLQAMIRAAGFYIKLEAGYPEAAAKLADKAATVLTRHRDSLPPAFPLESLLDCLRRREPVAPLLGQGIVADY